MSSSSLAALTMVLVLASGYAIAADESPDEPALGKFVPFSPPRSAPHVSFTDLAGKPVALQDFAGKVVVVNLWATWCAPCRREMPSLERLQDRLGDKIAILAVSEDMGGAKAVDPFIAKLGLKRIKPYLDPKSAVGNAFKVDGLPTSFLIDREGKLQGRVEGEAEWDSSKMLAVIARFLPDEDIVKTAFPRERP